MKIKSVTLKNFRCFKEISVSLHPNMTVLVAENGKGKTTILDAIRIGLWPYIEGFDLAKTGYNDPANTITVGDVRWGKSDITQARQLPAQVTMIGDFGSGLNIPIHQWSRYRESEAKRSQVKEDDDSKLLRVAGRMLQREIRNLLLAPLNLPVLGYYGTGRLWHKKNLKIKQINKTRKGDDITRTFAYRDCIDPASNFKQFEEWFTLAFKKMREAQIRQLELGATEQIPEEIKNPINVVQAAVNEMLRNTGWQDLTYSEIYDQSLVLNHPTSGVLKVDQLSDGIKNMLALVADIAYRCALLNPHLGTEAAKQSQGLVMIDEIDMHLHPSWQQTVVANLMTAFPNIQFIITTHSPQVLSSIHKEFIRLIDMDNDGNHVAVMPIAESYGEMSSDVLQTVMYVNPIPPIKEKTELDQLIEWVDQGRYEQEDAKQLLNQLKQSLGESHSQIQKLIRSIKRQQVLKL